MPEKYTVSKEALEVLGEETENVLLCKWVRPETPAYLSTYQGPLEGGGDKKSMILAQELTARSLFQTNIRTKGHSGPAVGKQALHSGVSQGLWSVP